MSDRPEIPLPMQRAIRQRCGFGCVVCGLPIYEYDHLRGYNHSQGHVESEITLLCDQHHKEKTNGLLTLTQVSLANNAPYNLQSGVSKPYDLHYSGSECEAIIGGNRFTTTDRGYGTQMIPLSIDGIPLVGFIMADGHLLVSLNLFDETNEPVLRIRNNELVFRTGVWDISFVGRALTVRQAARDILTEIVFEPPHRIIVKRGRFLCNGVEVLVRPDHLLITNNATLLSACESVDCTGGLIIGPHPKQLGGFMKIDGVTRYLGDRGEAVRWARESLNPGTQSGDA